MPPKFGEASGGETKKRKRSNVPYLSWAAQAKIKRQRVDEMMVKRAYFRQQGHGTGANEGVRDSGWGSRAGAAGEEDKADVQLVDGPVELGADRMPVKMAAPAIEKTRLPKVRPPKKVEPPPEPIEQATKPPRDDLSKETRKDEDKEQDGPRFRDLKRQAYSRNSLHMYKSRTTHEKNNGSVVKRTGKGQPNMKLRMNVMLEQIKRSKAS